MLPRFLVLLASATLCAGLCAACSGGSDSDQDAGSDTDGRQPCRTDANCDAPETCQPDGFCDLVIDPDPESNQADGTFSLLMDNWNTAEPGVDVDFSGKFNAKYIYLDFGGVIYPDEDDGLIHMHLMGILTNTLFHEVVVEMPPGIQVDTPIGIGEDGDATGTLDLVETDSKGNPKSRKTLGEIKGGQVTFDQYGEERNDTVSGSIEVLFLPVKSD